MKITKHDKALLFSSTEIPDIFFTEYLPEASGNSIKVYLYILFLSKYNKEIKINDLSKTLGLDFKVVQEALKYLEEKEIIIKNPDGYTLADIQDLELSKIYSPKVTSSIEDIEKNSQNQQRAKAIEQINTLFFQGAMSPSWYNDIDLWFNKYKFDDQVMLGLFHYAHEKGSVYKNYIQATADAWSKNNIVTFNDLDLYFEKQEKRNTLKSQITKKLKLYRNLTSYEEDYISKWTENFGYPMDVIEIALKTASANNKVRFNYIDTLITDWYQKELKTPEDVTTYLDSLKNKDIKTKQIEKISNEYTQSTFDNLDALYEN